MTLEDFRISDSFKTERNILFYSGFYPQREIKYKLLYHLSGIIHAGITGLTLMSMLLSIFINSGGLSEISDVLMFSITHGAMVLKLIIFLFSKNKLLHIEDLLQDKLFVNMKPCQIKMFKQTLANCNKLANFYRINTAFSVTSYCIFPLLGDMNERPIPTNAWFPWNVQNYRTISYLLQVCNILMSAYVNTSFDILVCKLITIGTAQFKILKDNLQTIDYNNDNDQVKTEVKLNIKLHIFIIRYCKRVQEFFSLGIFIQFATTVVVICFTGFQMIVVPFASAQFAFLIAYITCMLWQIAIYCWFGHDITYESSGVNQELYTSNWYKGNIETKKYLFMIMERTKRPIIITAIGMVDLSLPALVQILRSSYSYFAVLQRLYSSE